MVITACLFRRVYLGGASISGFRTAFSGDPWRAQHGRVIESAADLVIQADLTRCKLLLRVFQAVTESVEVWTV